MGWLWRATVPLAIRHCDKAVFEDSQLSDELGVYAHPTKLARGSVTSFQTATCLGRSDSWRQGIETYLHALCRMPRKPYQCALQ
jgi:hypothetical protein